MTNDTIVQLTATEFLNDHNSFIENIENITINKINGTKFGLELKIKIICKNRFIEKSRSSATIYYYSIKNMKKWLINKGFISYVV